MRRTLACLLSTAAMSTGTVVAKLNSTWRHSSPCSWGNLASMLRVQPSSKQGAVAATVAPKLGSARTRKQRTGYAACFRASSFWWAQPMRLSNLKASARSRPRWKRHGIGDQDALLPAKECNCL
jgi:hypothetical protein